MESTFPSLCAERVFNSPLSSMTSMPRRRSRSISPSPPPTRRLRFRRLTPHQILHRIADQQVHIARLIAVYGPTRRVSFTSAHCPDHVILATLYECFSIGEILSIENFIILDDHSS